MDKDVLKGILTFESQVLILTWRALSIELNGQSLIHCMWSVSVSVSVDNHGFRSIEGFGSGVD